MTAGQPKSVAFRRERERTWRQLEAIVESAEANGLRGLAPRDRLLLPKLYRATASALSVSRAIALDRNLLEYLESLTARAYCAVYGARGGLWRSILRFLRETWPAAIRAMGGRIAVAAIVLCAGAWIGYSRTAADPEMYYAFVDPGLAQGRDPLADTDSLRKTLYDAGQSSKGWLGAFAAMLFTHNTQVAMLAFALGIVAGVPTLLLLFMTGTMLGAMHAVFAERGLGVAFASWILPHGVTEILAIVIAGAAGLGIGSAGLFPGRLSRLAALRRAGHEGARVMAGVVVMLAIAGAIEGIFRQTVTDHGARFGLAALTAVFWFAYFALCGRAAERNARAGGSDG